jgi:sugar phosphate isomerase/epimerase
MPPHLSVSNIGFPGGELERALALIVEFGVDAIEVAPYNVFGRWDVSDEDIDLFRARLKDSGIHCPALQGIVYNAGPVHLFESIESRDRLFQHLAMVARMAGRLGAKACVFGAPRTRDPGELAPAKARSIAVEFLRRIGPVFAAEGTTLAVEPNARRYACRFITTTAEAIDLLDEVNEVGVGLQIDTGTVFLEHEDPAILSRAASYAVHAHVSEPDLAPIGSSDVEHRPLAEAMRAGGYQGSLSIEMKSVPDWPSAIRRAIAFTQEIYLR